jgi:hypothetical protein
MLPVRLDLQRPSEKQHNEVAIQRLVARVTGKARENDVSEFIPFAVNTRLSFCTLEASVTVGEDRNVDRARCPRGANSARGRAEIPKVVATLRARFINDKLTQAGPRSSARVAPPGRRWIGAAPRNKANRARAMRASCEYGQTH